MLIFPCGAKFLKPSYFYLNYVTNLHHLISLNMPYCLPRNFEITSWPRITVTVLSCSILYIAFAFSALMLLALLGGRKGIWPVKNWVVVCCRGYLPGAMCRFAYSLGDAMATHRFLL